MNQREQKRRDESFDTMIEVIDTAFEKLKQPERYVPEPQRDLIDEMIMMAPEGLSSRQRAMLEHRRARLVAFDKTFSGDM
jgi:hypothetical protein